MAELNVAIFFQIFALSRQNPLLDFLMVFGAEYLIFLTFLTVGVLTLIGSVKERKALIIVALGFLIQFIIRKVVHVIYFEPRPFVTYQITPLIEHAANAAFPSGHTTIMATVASAYYFCKSKFTLLFILLMLWVGLSRIFVGVHYPLDILGGILTGFISVALAWPLKNLLKQKFST